MLSTPKSRAIAQALSEALAASPTAQTCEVSDVLLGCSEFWALAMMASSLQATGPLPERLHLLDVLGAQAIQQTKALLTQRFTAEPVADEAGQTASHARDPLALGGTLMPSPRPPRPHWDRLTAVATYAGLRLLDRVAYVVLAMFVVGLRLWRWLRWVLALIYVGLMANLFTGPPVIPLPTDYAVLLLTLWPLLFAVLGYRMKVYPRWTALVRLAVFVGLLWFMREVHRHHHINLETSINIVVCAMGNAGSCEHVTAWYEAIIPQGPRQPGIIPGSLR
jgi:hypothetical protein